MSVSSKKDGLITVIALPSLEWNEARKKSKVHSKLSSIPTSKIIPVQQQLSDQLAISKPNVVADINSLQLPDQILTRMFNHQREGVAWMYGLYLSKKGGILGDDMGLGKTFQLICLLIGLIRKEEIKRILILAPVAVLENWKRELQEHLVPNVQRIHVQMISSEMNKKTRIKLLSQLFLSRHPSIVLTSYQLFSNMTDDFCIDDMSRDRRERVWDYIVLDEGHIIKNPQTKLSKAVYELTSRHKLLLTGTPMQNHLTEFWALIDWISNGTILGAKSYFIRQFSEPIMKGQDPKATEESREAATRAIEELLRLVRPILLQRKKCEHEAVLKLPSKTEVAVWIPLSSMQRKIYDYFYWTNIRYEEYLASREMSRMLNQSTYPLLAINKFKTLCRHPFLLEASEMAKKRRIGLDEEDQVNNHENNEVEVNENINLQSMDDLEESMNKMSIFHGSYNKEIITQPRLNSSHLHPTPVKPIRNNANVFEIAEREPSEFDLMQGSVKLRVLLKLTKRLLRKNHRVLIFSQSKLMLDIIQRVLSEHGMASFRIDGSSHSKDRQKIIDEFNQGGNNEDSNDDEYSGPDICLLTTKACGYGINLTGADRVIIFDPSWNPSEDRQAVDRAYRIGQSKDVVVYRMIMAGSIEEKMYEKQVFKDGLRIITESGTTSSRYFSREETMKLFELGSVGHSIVMEKLWQIQGFEMKNSPDDYDGETIQGVLGYTRHDKLYNENNRRKSNDQKKSEEVLDGDDSDKKERKVIDLSCEEEEKDNSNNIDLSDYLPFGSSKERNIRNTENQVDVVKKIPKRIVVLSDEEEDTITLDRLIHEFENVKVDDISKSISSRESLHSDNIHRHVDVNIKTPSPVRNSIPTTMTSRKGTSFLLVESSSDEENEKEDDENDKEDDENGKENDENDKEDEEKKYVSPQTNHFSTDSNTDINTREINSDIGINLTFDNIRINPWIQYVDFVAMRSNLNDERNNWLHVYKPMKTLSEFDLENYKNKILSASSAETRGDMNQAISYYMDAMDICDEDISLHQKLAHIHQQWISKQ